MFSTICSLALHWLYKAYVHVQFNSVCDHYYTFVCLYPAIYVASYLDVTIICILRNELISVCLYDGHVHFWPIQLQRNSL